MVMDDTLAADTALPEKAAGAHDQGSDRPGEGYEPVRTLTGWKWALAYASLMSTVLLFALDNTIVATIQPTIVETFGHQEDLAWIGVSFVLGQSLILPIGKSFGMFNMKLVFLTSLILFEGGSAICGAAPNMAALIIGRVIAGIGGSGLYVGALTYISVLTTTTERPIYLAGVMTVWGVGNVLGPVVGGSLAESSATWRWGFYINLPIAGLFAPGFVFLLPSINAMPETSLRKKLGMQDWVGIFIFTAFCACFCMAGSFGGTLYAWDSESEIALWVMTVLLLIAVVLVTIFHPFVPPEGRMMPVQFMKTKDLILLPLQSFLVAGSMMMSIFYTPLIFQFTKGDNALQGGIRILPLICMIVFGCLLNGFLMPKFGYYIPWYVIGNALLVTGAALMTTIDAEISNSSLYGYTVLIGLGIGCFQSAGIAVVSALAPASEVNNAVSIMTISQVLGIILALSVSGSVFQNMALRYLGTALPDANMSELGQLVTGTSGEFYKSLDTDEKFVVVQQVTAAIRDSFYYLCGVTAIGFITSLFLSRKKLFVVDGVAPH
ncbi:mfs transporter [Diaporthe amygdali]|uniref:mfs transporter n=1 Tax=Phomopsis amygdali TaxID=1214568 RepID=UPI0022FEA0AE|nr:mfs transporter [Diaporthe amygdali]KAJ0108707.1 mfs transporter [Diaporthe amygdali]